MKIKHYDIISDLLLDQIERVQTAIALDTTNADLVAQKDSLIERKMKVDQIREQASKFAIENGGRGARSSPLKDFMSIGKSKPFFNRAGRKEINSKKMEIEKIKITKTLRIGQPNALYLHSPFAT